MRPLVVDFIAGMGGRDVTPRKLEDVVSYTVRAWREGRVEREVVWVYGRRAL